MAKMKESILQGKSKCCYVTGHEFELHKHHIFGGANRNISEREGFWIWLIPAYHNMTDKGIHFDNEFSDRVKAECQRKYEETHSREEFIRLIGRNYIM